MKVIIENMIKDYQETGRKFDTAEKGVEETRKKARKVYKEMQEIRAEMDAIQKVFKRNLGMSEVKYYKAELDKLHDKYYKKALEHDKLSKQYGKFVKDEGNVLKWLIDFRNFIAKS